MPDFARKATLQWKRRVRLEPCFSVTLCSKSPCISRDWVDAGWLAGLWGVVFGRLSCRGSYNKPSAQTCSLEHSLHSSELLNLGLFQQKSMCKEAQGWDITLIWAGKKEPERVNLPIVITVLLASQETKVPEEKHSEDKTCIIARLISLRQPHDFVQGWPWQCHIRVKLKSLCPKCFDLRAVPFIGAKNSNPLWK